MADVQTRHPVDTEATRALIAKIKKGDQDNADAIATEVENRTDADAEIIESLDDETTARRINDELLQEQINEVAVQTDWNQDDSTALDYLKNRPSTISDLEIEALFI